MRKQGLCAFVSLLLFMTACGKEPAENGADLSHSDHEILTEADEITPMGEHRVRILFADVGKADAILVEIDGGRYLVDTGAAESLPDLLAAMAYMEWDSLDGLFVTHTHNDHMGGAVEMCRRYSPQIYYTAAISEHMEKLASPALANQIPHEPLEPGSVVALAENVYFEVLAPYRYYPGDDNNNSLVLRLRVNNATLLLAADMLYDEERTLLGLYDDLSTDVLKVGHHGAKDASGAGFVEAVGAQTVIISTDSTESPPHDGVISLYEEQGASVLVTEDHDVGILLTIAPDGGCTVADGVRKPPQTDGLAITCVSRDTQTVTIRNTGADLCALGGCFLFSENGSELFVFPSDAMIGAGEEITVGCAGAGDYAFEGTRVWSRVAEDVAVLYDPFGNVLDSESAQ